MPRSATCRPTRAKQLKDAGIQRVHHNVETARSYYDEVSTTVRYEGRIRTIDAVKEAGLESCVGGILNLGESPRQRVEMAFELSEIDPESVPINLLNPRSGTKFGDREMMDPWDVVKWVAIFRLILPDALFRLCGGRVENLGELQPLAVKAGLNGVMMGNFLTTLGVEPSEDREMFEELGLNVARQDDNGSNPRPDNRSGWLEGETPATPIDELIDSQADANFWDPSTQLRVMKTQGKGARLPEARSPPRRACTGRPRTRSGGAGRGRAWLGRLSCSTSATASPSSAKRASIAGSASSRVRRARRWCSTAARCCSSAPTTTSGSPITRPFAAPPRTRPSNGVRAPEPRG